MYRGDNILKRRGQASLEYLTTYGWAFILIIIMVGAMAFFGILNPKKLLPDRCAFSSDISCKDFVVSTEPDQVMLKLQNNVGEAIVIDSFALDSETGTLGCSDAKDSNGVFDIVTYSSGSSGYVWDRGATWDITFSGCDLGAVGFFEGNKEKILIKLNYFMADSTSAYLHLSEGEVVSTIQ